MKAQEHRALGDEASGGASVLVGGLRLTFGDVVALTGDYFFPVDNGGHGLAGGGLFELASRPGVVGTQVGTWDEVLCALRVMAADQGLVDPRFGTGPGADTDSDVERRVRDRFLALGAANDDHFVAPGARGPATTADRAAPGYGSAGLAYRSVHRRALGEARRLGREGGDLEEAMAWEAAAQHYLTDAFAAGHLRTPVAAIREFWQRRYPWFWEGLQRKVASETAAALRELAAPLRLVSSRYLHGRTLAAVQARTEGYPQVSFGDLVAKVFHDWDNEHGLVLDDGTLIYGDGCLEQGVTRQRALAAARAGIDEVEAAFETARRGRDLARYVEIDPGLPRLSAENPPQNWQAPDVEALWESPIVGSDGTTVGEAVAAALSEGQELPTRLGCLGSGITSSLDVPPVPGLRTWIGKKACDAYHRGFLDSLTGDPRSCVMDVVGSRTAERVHAHAPG
jgi:hypothetical protein